MRKFLLLIFLLSYNIFFGQEINYSLLNTTSTNFKNYLSNNDDYFSGGSEQHPYYQGKIDSKYIKFYNTTGVIAVIDFKSKREFLQLVKQIQNNALFNYKVCPDYNSQITYNYKTSMGNSLRFNFNEMRISLEFPSKINNFLEENGDLLPGFVCLSDDAYAFHTNIKCEGLGNCNEKIAQTDIREAKKYGYRYCEICTDDSYSKKLLQEALGIHNTNTPSLRSSSSFIDLSFAKKYNGEYMFQEICETEPLKSALKKQFGKEIYDKYINYIAVQGPMEIEQNKALLTSCMAHACGIYMSSLFIDFNNNFYYAGILDDEKVYVISNNSDFDSQNWNTYPVEFAEWTQDALKDAQSNK